MLSYQKDQIKLNKTMVLNLFPFTLIIMLIIMQCLTLCACGSSQSKVVKHKSKPIFNVHILSRRIFQVRSIRFSRLANEKALYLTNAKDGKVWRYDLRNLSKLTQSNIKNEPPRTKVKQRSILRQANKYEYTKYLDVIRLGDKKNEQLGLVISSKSDLEKCCQLKLLTLSSNRQKMVPWKDRNLKAGHVFQHNSVGDFNGDGYEDLISLILHIENDHQARTTEYEHEIILFVGSKTGSLKEVDRLLRKDEQLMALKVIDLEGDGRDEIPYYHYQNNKAGLWVIKVKKNNKLIVKRVLTPKQDARDKFIFADINGDQKVDVITDYTIVRHKDKKSQCCDVFINQGNGKFKYTSFKMGQSKVKQARIPKLAFDVDGDGKEDLIQFDRVDQIAQWKHKLNVWSNKKGKFKMRKAKLNYKSGYFNRSCNIVDVADFDHDGDLDMLCADYGASRIHNGVEDIDPKHSNVFLLENLTRQKKHKPKKNQKKTLKR